MLSQWLGPQAKALSAAIHRDPLPQMQAQELEHLAQLQLMETVFAQMHLRHLLQKQQLAHHQLHASHRASLASPSPAWALQPSSFPPWAGLAPAPCAPGFYHARFVQSLQPKAPAPAPAGPNVQAAYARGLVAAGVLIDQSCAPATLHQRKVAGSALLSWLGQQSPPRDLTCCSAEDLTVYLEQWLRQHGRSILPSTGKLVAAASSLNTLLGHLSSVFAEVGRTGPYTPATGAGNPTKARSVQQLSLGHCRQMFIGGLEVAGAVPVTFDKVAAVLNHMDSSRTPALGNPFEQLVVYRDALAFLFLYTSSVRGDNCSRLTTSELLTRCTVGAPLQPLSLPLPSPLPPDFQLVVRMRGTKAAQLACGADITFSLDIQRPASHCVVQRLSEYATAWAAAHGGQQLVGPLFRPLQSDQQGFGPTAMRTSTLLSRWKVHLSNSGQNGGETLHSFRRGSLQAVSHAAAHSAAAASAAAFAAGGAAAAAVLPSPAEAGRAAAAAAGQILTPRVVELYLHETRHEPRLKRAASLAASVVEYKRRRGQ